MPPVSSSPHKLRRPILRSRTWCLTWIRPRFVPSSFAASLRHTMVRIANTAMVFITLARRYVVVHVVASPQGQLVGQSSSLNPPQLFVFIPILTKYRQWHPTLLLEPVQAPLLSVYQFSSISYEPRIFAGNLCSYYGQKTCSTTMAQEFESSVSLQFPFIFL
jgi:hypothetical protein